MCFNAALCWCDCSFGWREGAVALCSQTSSFLVFLLQLPLSQRRSIKRSVWAPNTKQCLLYMLHSLLPFFCKTIQYLSRKNYCCKICPTVRQNLVFRKYRHSCSLEHKCKWLWWSPDFSRSPTSESNLVTDRCWVTPEYTRNKFIWI